MCYFKFSQYLKSKFGTKVHKVSVDAGFSCPNKDGKIGSGGCIFCDNKGFSFNTRLPSRPLEIQIEEGIKAGKRRFKAERFIVYFQAYTNTYAPLSELKARYDVIKKYPEVVGLSIATRPDCIDEPILDLINSYTDHYEVWLEYGLQSIHQKTLDFINRGHYFDAFLKAVQLTRSKTNIKICCHVIIGLPYEWSKKETKQMIRETAREIGNMELEGIKIHPLHIIKGTKLEAIFREGGYQPLELEEYVELAVEFLEYLSPNTVVQRISADCPKNWLVAPLWILNKQQVIRTIEKRLKERATFQGAKQRDKKKEQEN